MNPRWILYIYIYIYIYIYTHTYRVVERRQQVQEVRAVGVAEEADGLGLLFVTLQLSLA